MAAFTITAPTQSIPYLGQAKFKFQPTASGVDKAAATDSVAFNGITLNGYPTAVVTPVPGEADTYKVENIWTAGHTISLVYSGVDSAIAGSNTIQITQPITLLPAENPINGGYVVYTPLVP